MNNYLFQLSNSYTPKTTHSLWSIIPNLSIVFVYCVIFCFELSYAETINPVKDPNHQDIFQRQQSQHDRQQCFIGYYTTNPPQYHNSLPTSEYTLQQATYTKFINIKQPTQWKYCMIKQSTNNKNTHKVQYFSNWQQCRQKCCTTISYNQCYFKASTLQQQQSIQSNNKKSSYYYTQKYKNTKNQIIINTINQINRKRFLTTTGNNSNNNNNGNADQSNNKNVSSSQLLSSGDSTSTDQQSSSSGTDVVMIVLLSIFGVPFALLMFFAILSIIKLCRNSSRPIVAINNVNPTQSMIIQQINIDEYKLDEVGPYHINLQQQCSICLDQNVNIRTHCGHLYHPQCIKAWLMKGKNRCPVCNCTRLNPMKLYCKRCSVGIKLIVVNRLTTQEIILQLRNLQCDSCIQDKNQSFSPTPSNKQNKSQNKQPKQVNNNNNRVQKKYIQQQQDAEEQNQQIEIQIIDDIRQSSNQLRHNTNSNDDEQVAD